MTSINTAEKRFNFTDIISYNCPLKDWLNLIAVSISATLSTKLLILMPLTRKCFGWIHLWTSRSFHRGENKQAPEAILWFPSLKLSKHEIVWKPHTTVFLTGLGMIKKRYAVTKAEPYIMLWCYVRSKVSAVRLTYQSKVPNPPPQNKAT